MSGSNLVVYTKISLQEYITEKGKRGVDGKKGVFPAFEGKIISAEEVMEVSRRLGKRCSLHNCHRMVGAVHIDRFSFLHDLKLIDFIKFNLFFTTELHKISFFTYFFVKKK